MRSQGGMDKPPSDKPFVVSFVAYHKGGDLCLQGDAIVNAANKAMVGGGGVDGAIHRAAGSSLKAICREYPDPEGIRCPTGHARITTACRLHAKWVIHTVGPIYRTRSESEPLLRLAYACAATPRHWLRPT
jgi:O-acetyl-ADP-ribose deacetylase